MRNLIFVDTESTGLADDPDARMVELTWATIDSEPETLWFGVKEVPDFIDKLISFTPRGIAGRISDHFSFQRFLKASDGQTMVAANPSHDMHFIQSEGLWKFHYRMLDIESYAMAKLNLDYVPGMKDLYNTLANELTVEPDHTSRNDVLAMREIYKILVDM